MPCRSDCIEQFTLDLVWSLWVELGVSGWTPGMSREASIRSP